MARTSRSPSGGGLSGTVAAGRLRSGGRRTASSGTPTGTGSGPPVVPQAPSSSTGSQRSHPERRLSMRSGSYPADQHDVGEGLAVAHRQRFDLETVLAQQRDPVGQLALVERRQPMTADEGDGAID